MPETRGPAPQNPADVIVVGAGLAGSECAWVLAEHYKLSVLLWEMKPAARTPAQHMPDAFAELVCSNSLKSTSLANPSGVLKTEMAGLGSLVMPSAFTARVPAGEALAVDREAFSGQITTALRNHPRITVRTGVVTDTVELRRLEGCQRIVVATGPLTHGDLAQHVLQRAGAGSANMLYFYDAIAPILDGATIDRSVAFFGDRETRSRARDKTQPESGEQRHGDAGDYLNLPLNREEYFGFVEALLQGDKVPHHDFEEPRYFNACQPIEALAASGPLTLAHGPMKGRGLTDPRTGRWPFAAIQLRREKLGHDAFNMVGFQTRLTWTAQRAIFSRLPGMAHAEFHRMGSMHRNTYICSPQLLGPCFALRNDTGLHVCGQIMGVEGYLESAAMGLLTAHLIGQQLRGRECPLPPPTTAMGALARHVKDGDPAHYAPMNLNWGLFDPLLPLSEEEARASAGGPLVARDKGARRLALSERARRDFDLWKRHLS